jgi:hypothetical protein
MSNRVKKKDPSVPSSFRFPPEDIVKLNDLAQAFREETGVTINKTTYLLQLIRREHKKLGKKGGQE